MNDSAMNGFRRAVPKNAAALGQRRSQPLIGGQPVITLMYAKKDQQLIMIELFERARPEIERRQLTSIYVNRRNFAGIKRQQRK